jgi:LuxR family transcriptional regulator
MTPADRIDAALVHLRDLAPAGYFLALRIRGSAPLMSFATYPQEWTDHYMANGYVLRDPITTWAMTVGGAIRWSSRLLPDPFGVFRQAAGFGLRFGASVAHGPLGALSILSMSRGDREFTDAEIAAAKTIVLQLHALTELPRALEPEDRALLAQVDAGKAPDSPQMRALCERLFAATPEQALRRARDHKLY